MKHVIVLTILGLMLSACGQKGSLYLPESSQSLQSHTPVENNVTLAGKQFIDLPERYQLATLPPFL